MEKPAWKALSVAEDSEAQPAKGLALVNHPCFYLSSADSGSQQEVLSSQSRLTLGVSEESAPKLSNGRATRTDPRPRGTFPGVVGVAPGLLTPRPRRKGAWAVGTAAGGSGLLLHVSGSRASGQLHGVPAMTQFPAQEKWGAGRRAARPPTPLRCPLGPGPQTGGG